MSKNSMLDAAQIDAISRGDHDNPFSVLGMHVLAKKGVVVRTFLPFAEKVQLVDESSGDVHDMPVIGAAGVYEIIISSAKKPFPYHFLVTWPGQPPQKQYDPYNYGTLISEFDLQIWGEGNHSRAYTFMGAHKREVGGVAGTHFVVWAPSAKRVSVIGPFNGWDGRRHVMRRYYDQGIWEIFIPRS
jgi:1,4-alpha-glucan branching enzyme